MRLRASPWLATALLATFFTALALATAPASHALLDAGLASLLYLLLAGVLVATGLLAFRLARPLGLLASLVVGTVVAWHVRELLGVPAAHLPFAALAALLGLLCFAWLRRAGARVSPQRAGLAALLSLLALTLTVVACYRGSDTFRWHLLRHHKLIGTPAYYLLGEPVASVREALWAHHRNSQAPPPPVVPSDPGAAARPNLVFLLIDTLRADALAALGGDPAQMPHLDRFAQNSLVFGNVMANATWTRPSVASMFTGLLQEEHGAVDRPFGLREEHRTLAELLRDEGYRTAAFVSNYGAVGREAGFAQGFDVFEEVQGEADVYARAAELDGAVLRWLSRESPREGGRPLFLYVHYLDPHVPYLSGGHDGVLHSVARSAYEAELRYLDSQLEPFLDAVAAHLAGPTFFLVTSDHGEEFGEHGERGHGKSLYREVLWIPVLLRGPGVRPGITPARLEGRDVFELLAGLAGAGIDDVEEWASHRDRASRYASIYSTTPSGLHRPYLETVAMRGLELDRKLLIWSAYGQTLELYDLERDPNQTVNLARSAPDLCAALYDQLDAPIRGWAVREPVGSDDDAVRQLRALGYLR